MNNHITEWAKGILPPQSMSITLTPDGNPLPTPCEPSELTEEELIRIEEINSMMDKWIDDYNQQAYLDRIMKELEP